MTAAAVRLDVEALIADNQMRQRDARFVRQEQHRSKPDPLYDKSQPLRTLPLYQPSDFRYDATARTCVCPAGKSLYRKGRDLVINGYVCEQFQGAKRDCLPCTHRARRLRHPERNRTRQVVFIRGKRGAVAARPPTHSAHMRARIDSVEGRARYSQRFGTVEPVFANLCYNKGLTRFTLRGRAKVDGQWKLFCLVHNIEKLAHHGYAQ